MRMPPSFSRAETDSGLLAGIVELIGELLDRHDLVGAEQKDRQDTSLSPAAELDRPVPHQHFEWAKDAELSIHLCQL
jgi:hypothetical protein